MVHEYNCITQQVPGKITNSHFLRLWCTEDRFCCEQLQNKICVATYAKNCYAFFEPYFHPCLVPGTALRPDGATLIPWVRRKFHAWDVTTPDTLASSHINSTCSGSGSVAMSASQSKTKKYSTLSVTHVLVPVAVLNFRSMERWWRSGPGRRDWTTNDNGHWRPRVKHSSSFKGFWWPFNEGMRHYLSYGIIARLHCTAAGHGQLTLEHYITYIQLISTVTFFFSPIYRTWFINIYFIKMFQLINILQVPNNYCPRTLYLHEPYIFMYICIFWYVNQIFINHLLK